MPELGVGGHGEDVRVRSASALEVSALIDLFNHSYSDYAVPLQLSEAAFRDHVEVNGVDLDCSQVVLDPVVLDPVPLDPVVLDPVPLAFCLIARRGAAGWVAGMGTVPEHRRQGAGYRALTAAVTAARAAGCHDIWLEVIDSNRAAHELYLKVGFRDVRDLNVWSLSPSQGELPISRTVEPEDAHTWIVANRLVREPWQRADEALAVLRARGARLRGIVIERGGEVRGAVVLTDEDGTTSVRHIAARDEAVAADLLLAAGGGQRQVQLANVPVDDPASLAMQRLGADLVARQHEMRLGRS